MFSAFDPFSTVLGTIRGGQGQGQAERVIAENGFNTALTYEYSDLNNYQTSRRVVFAGEFDPKDIKKLIKKMNRNWEDHFLPEAVGLDDIRYDLTVNYPTVTFPDDEVDTKFHEIVLPTALKTTQDAPTDLRTWQEFMQEFLDMPDDAS